jgi:hypothetical protein
MPNNKMERFTQRAQRVLMLAEEIALQLQQPVIGTEHILVGLLREENGVASRVLHNLSLKDKAVIKRIEDLAADNDRMAVSMGTLELSPATKRLLELAVEEARILDHHYIGTEHLLLGLVRQENSAAVYILKHYDITPEQVRQQTQRTLQEPSPQIDMLTEASEPTAVEADLIDDPPAAQSKDMAMGMAIVTKVLEMVAENKLTADQGCEILRGLNLDLTFTPAGKARFASMVNLSGENLKRRVHITVYDSATKKNYFELNNSLDQLLSFIDHFLSLVSNNDVESLVFDGDNSPFATELRIEKDEGTKE